MLKILRTLFRCPFSVVRIGQLKCSKRVNDGVRTLRSAIEVQSVTALRVLTVHVAKMRERQHLPSITRVPIASSTN